MRLFRVMVYRNMSIGVGCLSNIWCDRFVFARTSHDPSCLILRLVLGTLGSYDASAVGGSFLLHICSGSLFVGGLVCLCCNPNPLVERYIFAFRFPHWSESMKCTLTPSAGCSLMIWYIWFLALSGKIVLRICLDVIIRVSVCACLVQRLRGIVLL